MSFQLFLSDLQKEPLTVGRLQNIWEFYNLKNKSDLIDILTKSLFSIFQKRAEKASVETDQITLSVPQITSICTKFSNEIVRKMIPSQKPMLEVLPSGLSDQYPLHKYNPQTSIVFKTRSTEDTSWVAMGVIKGSKLFDLRLSQMNICISNGWYFETDRDDIVSPFRVNKHT